MLVVPCCSGCPEKLALAVLHPRKVGVYEFVPQSMNKGRAAYYTLESINTQALGLDGNQFTAYNMICAPFNRATDRYVHGSVCLQIENTDTACDSVIEMLCVYSAWTGSCSFSNTMVMPSAVYSRTLCFPDHSHTRMI